MRSTSYSSLALTLIALGSSFTGGRRLRKRDCAFTWPATNGDTCATMSHDWAIDEATFKAMNPGVNCSSLVPGQEYCTEWDGELPVPPVVTPTTTPSPAKPSSTTLITVTSSSTTPGGPAQPSPVQSGVAADCRKWYLVEPENTCQGIVDTYKTFTLAEFYQWNPAVGTSCKFLQVDVFVCVGVPGTPTAAVTTTTPKPTKTTTKTTTTKPAAPETPKPCRWNAANHGYDCPGVWPAPPGPTQTGIPYDCIKWVLQKDGVYCDDMAKSAGITLARFYTLNPAIGSNCGGLWPLYAYCVATE